MSIKRTILQALPLSVLPGWESRLVLVEYAPGVAAPVHNHPVPSTGYIIEGEVISQFENSAVEHYSAGDSFFELAEVLHVRSENINQTGVLKMLASYVVKIDEPNVEVKHLGDSVPDVAGV